MEKDLVWQFATRLMMSCGALFALGCRGDEPARYRVVGSVLVDGVAIDTGNVMFVSESGVTAASAVSADGRYELDAEAGKHQVGVVSIPPVPSGEDWRKIRGPPSRVPKRYARPDSSQIVVEVQAVEENEIDIEMSSRE